MTEKLKPKTDDAGADDEPLSLPYGVKRKIKPSPYKKPPRVTLSAKSGRKPAKTEKGAES